MSLVALALHTLPAYRIAVAMMGWGFGTAFLGVLKTLMPRVTSAERAEVMAIICTDTNVVATVKRANRPAGHGR